jgi:hypothetical protein
MDLSPGSCQENNFQVYFYSNRNTEHLCVAARHQYCGKSDTDKLVKLFNASMQEYTHSISHSPIKSTTGNPLFNIFFKIIGITNKR